MHSKPQSIHREWQWPLSGVHSIIRVKSAEPGRGGDTRPPPPPFTLSTITSKVVVYAPAKRAGTLPLFLLYPYMYSVLHTSYEGWIVCKQTPDTDTLVILLIEEKFRYLELEPDLGPSPSISVLYYSVKRLVPAYLLAVTLEIFMIHSTTCHQKL
jgi:hypothetical protein